MRFSPKWKGVCNKTEPHDWKHSDKHLKPIIRILPSPVGISNNLSVVSHNSLQPR